MSRQRAWKSPKDNALLEGGFVAPLTGVVLMLVEEEAGFLGDGEGETVFCLELEAFCFPFVLDTD